MEASESIVESYLRAVKNCFTIANIKLKQNKEIDLLAIDPEGQKYHIECSVKTTPAFSGIHARSESESKHKAKWRMSLLFFESKKFNHPIVKDAIREYGFEDDAYKKVIVASRVMDDVLEIAAEKGIEIWLFNSIIDGLMEAADREQYLSGDERVFQLIARWLKEKEKDNQQTALKDERKSVREAKYSHGGSKQMARKVPKYRPLQDHLSNLRPTENEVRFTFREIERIIGDRLPASARNHRAWWANEQSGMHVEAHAWMNAGWKVEEVSFSEEWVRFIHA